MPAESKKQGKDRRLRLGMVGGGPGAFIGAVHRIAARMDDRYELVAAALSSDPGKSLAAAEARDAILSSLAKSGTVPSVEARRLDAVDRSLWMHE